MAVSEICKRLCRYLLHRYLGPFLEEKVALDQLHLSLDKGTGTVTQLSLDAVHLNETLAKYRLPFSVVDGYIGCVTVFLPLGISTAGLSSVVSVTAESFSNFEGLRLELSDVQFTLRGLDMTEAFLMGNSLDLLASSLCFSEFASASQSLAVDYSQSVFNTGIALPLEGLDQLASVIDSFVSKIEIVVKELVVRLEPPSSLTCSQDSSSISALELHLLKGCASFSSNDSSREVALSLTNIELRAETYADRGAESSGNSAESSYSILLRIPDANVSLSTSPSTFFTKVIASSLIVFFPGPDILCSVVSMLDSIFNKKRFSKENQAALFESVSKGDAVDPIMFESCAASVVSSDQFGYNGGDRTASSPAPSVHLIINIVRAAVVIAYNTPQGSLKPQSMSVAFFASLPTDFGISCSVSRNAFALCCPSDCLIVQLLSSKVDVVFNTQQQQVFSPLEREDSQSTLRNVTECESTAAPIQPFRMSVRLSVDCFDLSDCVRHAEVPSCTFTQLLICDDSDDARPALTLEILARFTGFKEIRISVTKPCQSEFDLSTVLSRIFPLANSISSFLLPNNESTTIQQRPSQSSSATFICKFEKLRLFVRFPKHQPLSVIGERDEFTLHPETLVLDTEKLCVQLTQIAPTSSFLEISRDLSLECQTLNGFFQVDPSQLPVSVFRISSFKADLLNHRRNSQSSAEVQHHHHQETPLFADPPMRLHNGREIHVPTQAHLRFSQNDSVTVDISVFNMSLPPARVLRLLSERVTELKQVFNAFTERKKFEDQQRQVMERSVLMGETTGNSIYYSMTPSGGAETLRNNFQHQKPTPVPSKPQFSSFGIRFEKFLVSATSSKLETEQEKKPRRGEVFRANAIVLVAFDLAVHFSTNNSGWARVGSLSLLDALSDPTNLLSPGGLEFFSPVIRSSISPQSSTVSSSSSHHSEISSKNSTLFAVLEKNRIGLRLSNVSLDLCSPPGKIPSCIQIACEIVQSFENEFRGEIPPVNVQNSLKPQKTGQKWDFCLEGSGLSFFLRTKTDQDFDAYGSLKPSTLPGLCLSFDSVLFDASSTSAIKVGPGQPPIGDLWLGISNTLLELCLKAHHQDLAEDSGDLHSGRRERMFQADWLEFTFGLSSVRGSTGFVDVCGSSVSVSTTVNNLSALCALVATVAAGLKSSQIGAGPTQSPSQEEIFNQQQLLETPVELKDALKESIHLTGASPPDSGFPKKNWGSPLSQTGSSPRDSSEDGDFFVLSNSFVKNLPKKAECRKLTSQSIPLNINDKYLEKPLFRPDPLSIQPRGWPTPVFRFTIRDTSVRCALMTERGDSLEIGLIRMSFRYERCPSWTPNLYRISASIHDIEVLERHPDLGLSNPATICSRLVAEDVPRIHSTPQFLLKMAFVRPSSCPVPLLKQNSVAVPQDAECDVRVSIQPIRIKASMRTVEILRNLTSKFTGLCQSAVNQPGNCPPEPNNAGALGPTQIKSPTHRLVGEVGRGAPVLFDETGGESGRASSTSSNPAPSGLFIRSFSVHPNVLLEVNFSGSISTTANVPIHLDKCRLTLPCLMETRSGFADFPRLFDYVASQWTSAIMSQKSAFVTAGTGLNKLTASAQELASATADLGALLLAPLYSDELPPAMTVDSQLRPGRVLRGITASAASLSADVVMRLFSAAVPLLQHASSAASSLISGQPENSAGVAINYQRSGSPELKSYSNTPPSVGGLSTNSGRERKNSRSQDDVLRKAATSALLAAQQVETAGAIFAHPSCD